MKTQISRDSRQPDQRYSAVYQQQGRAVLDSDVNEAADIAKQRLNDALSDAILSGAPAAGGFRINEDKTITSGTLYVDGIPATWPDGSWTLGNQPDLPEFPDLPEKDIYLYADVWERSVTAIEDQNLLDAGMHGADTCTRSQTMLQVKWAEWTADYNVEDFPARGDALLSVHLTSAFSGEDDECEPCKSSIQIDERIGNYLFRVEVHDVSADGNDITLKWSRDNGAEQFKVEQALSDFTTGNMVYEFFDSDSEKNLGEHHMGETPRRGELSVSYTVPASADENTCVRQWDGYCTLHLGETGADSIEGNDRSQDLVWSETASNSHRTCYLGDDGRLVINLELTVLTLDLTDPTFVAGDYWLAHVREADNASGDYILGDADAGVAPDGPIHHYLWLRNLTHYSGEHTVESYNDEQHRLFNFPPLSNITASDVGFTNECSDLYDSGDPLNPVDNVQEALNALCNINADNIAFDMPDCGAETVEGYLLANNADFPDLDGDEKTTVDDILHALLCRMHAGTLPYQVCDSGSDPTVRSGLGFVGGERHPLADIVDKLLCEHNAATLPHQLPGCGDAADPTVSSLLTLGNGKQTVADTLHSLLCDLSAASLPHQLPGCGDAADLTVNSLLALGNSKQSVADTLHNLLCDLSAASLPHQLPDCGDAADPTVNSLLGLGTGKQSVADTLHNLLCEHSAASLPHQLPACGDAAQPTVSSLMGLTGNQSVADTLRNLLCQLKADDLPLNMDPAALADFFKVDDDGDGIGDINNVQAALNALALRGGGSGDCCAIKVDAVNTYLDEQLRTFAQENPEVTGRSSIWLCLAEGEHTCQPDEDGVVNIDISGKDTIKIEGNGSQSSLVTLKNINWNLAAKEVILRDINFELAGNESTITIAADKVVIENCNIHRFSDLGLAVPMIEVRYRESSIEYTQLNVSNSTFSAEYTRMLVPFSIPQIVVPEISGFPEVTGPLTELLEKGPLAPDFNQLVSDTASGINGMPLSYRQDWQSAKPQPQIDQLAADGVVYPDEPLVSESLLVEDNDKRVTLINQFYQDLTEETMDDVQRQQSVTDLIYAVVETGYGHALGIYDPFVHVELDGNTFDGNLVTNSRRRTDGTLVNELLLDSAGTFNGDCQLVMTGNRVYRMIAYKRTLGPVKSVASIRGFAQAQISNNVFTWSDGSLVAVQLQLHHNQFTADSYSRKKMRCIGNWVMIDHNMLSGTSDESIEYQSSRPYPDGIYSNMGGGGVTQLA